jgi:D-alanine-D-alanine ligase
MEAAMIDAQRQGTRDAALFGRVAVLYGGQSAEREVSLKSGHAVCQALQASGVDAHGIDVGNDIIQQLQQGGFDRVFIVLHGRGGEDGVMQALLQWLGLPYTGSGVMASALAMDKLMTKGVWQGAGLPTPPYVLLDGLVASEQQAAQLGLPVIVKPAGEGSSIGMSKVEQVEELHSAWLKAAEQDARVFAERWVRGAEYTVAIIGDQALPLIRIETPNRFYDFEAKYQADTTRYICPCGLEPAREQELQRLALQAFTALGCSGWGRVDLFVDEAGQAWLIEVNTVPGMTDHSLVPMAAQAAGMNFQALVWRILELSLDANTAAADAATVGVTV